MKMNRDMSLVKCFLLVVCVVVPVDAAVSCTTLDFVIGILSPKAGESPLQKDFDDFSTVTNEEVNKCFNTPNSVSLNVDDVLNIPKSGWTKIKKGIDDAIGFQANTKKHLGLSVVVGPFYQNLAMILEDWGIPYVVTDYTGFDWSDINLVDSSVKWKNIVEVRPPMKEFNGAIVDYFVSKNWESAVMIMPEHPRENQECQNLAHQMVEHNISPISYTLRYQNEEEMKESTDEVLRNVQLLEQKRIVICSPRDEKYNLIQMVLEQAKLFRMLVDESYSFFILDPSTHLKALSEINMYRTGLFTAKCELLAYRYTDISNDSIHFDTGYGFGAADAARIINEAKYYYITDNDSTKNTNFSREIYLKALKTVKIARGETGFIEFNRTTGSRIGYSLSLYNYGGANLFSKIGSWEKMEPYETEIDNETTEYIPDPADRLTFIDVNETDTGESRGIFRDMEPVVVVLEEPFVMYRDLPKGIVVTGNDRFEGFTIDLLDRISRDLKFNYKIILSPNNEYGGPRGRDPSEAEWGGIVGEILAKNATLGMGAISITSQRQSVIDFSLGVVGTGVNILIHKPEEVLSIFQFLTPFSLELWMAIIGSSFGVSILYFLLDFRSKERLFTLKSTLWFSLGTLLMKGSEFSPKRTSQRILTTGFLFFVLITVSTYTANMAAFLTKKNLEEPVDSFEQLAERDDIQIYTVENSATMNFLKTSAESSVYHQIWEKIARDNHKGLVPNATVGRRKVEEGAAAFIFDSMINLYSEKRYCKTQSVSAPILLQEHGIAMMNGAPFKSQLNIELLLLKEEGFIQALRKKWWENTRYCDEDFQSRSSKQVSFELDHTAGVFIVGSFGLAAALTLFICKKIYVLGQRDSPFPTIRKEENSVGRSPEEKLIYGLTEGKQSTV
ncbi:glutamate receptor ionotropic, kainate 2-like [Mercenaria mercenaria]|uniref:glutamate receptor ionotropic, kainate 2-like n=1 Tax=Mercenaria mercenaria TaxID=6596 RepID=UPI00234F5F7F|nr:glutamate receptor ionotropic, kainate 2-like [Mercenaria mercenaria]